MHFRPCENKFQLTVREPTSNHISLLNIDQSPVAGIFRMEMRWIMIIIKHCYFDATKQRDRGHIITTFHQSDNIVPFMRKKGKEEMYQ